MYAEAGFTVDAVLKVGMAALMVLYLVAALRGRYWGQVPFIALFLSGFWALGLPSLGRTSLEQSSPLGPDVVGEHGKERKPQDCPGETRLAPLAGVLVASEPEVAGECEAA